MHQLSHVIQGLYHTGFIWVLHRFSTWEQLRNQERWMATRLDGVPNKLGEWGRRN